MNDGNSNTNSEWRHIQVVFKPVGSTDAADKAITTFDVANITGGQIDNSWTDADYTAVRDRILALATAWAGWMQSGYQLSEIRFYRRRFNPLGINEPFVKSGSPERVYLYSQAGSSTAYQARQVSWTTTERTTYPRHWGRNYWPFPGAGASQTNSVGLIPSATVNTWGAAVHDTYAQLMAAEFFPVVPVTQVDKTPTRGLLTVSAVQMDDIPDVVRRRRNKMGVVKYNAPVT